MDSFHFGSSLRCHVDVDVDSDSPCCRAKNGFQFRRSDSVLLPPRKFTPFIFIATRNWEKPLPTPDTPTTSHNSFRSSSRIQPFSRRSFHFCKRKSVFSSFFARTEAPFFSELNANAFTKVWKLVENENIGLSHYPRSPLVIPAAVQRTPSAGTLVLI